MHLYIHIFPNYVLCIILYVNIFLHRKKGIKIESERTLGLSLGKVMDLASFAFTHAGSQ